jgi:hypothetical protein
MQENELDLLDKRAQLLESSIIRDTQAIIQTFQRNSNLYLQTIRDIQAGIDRIRQLTTAIPEHAGNGNFKIETK